MVTIPQTVQQTASLPRTRIFGDDLAPPRQLYVTLVPAVLVLTGVMSWVMSNDQGMVLASFVATGVALFTLWDWLFRHAPTRFSTLLAMGLLIGYGMGTLNTWITLPRGSLTLGEVMGLAPGILARGLGATLISSATLYFLGEIFEKPMFGRDFRLYIDSRTCALIYVGTIAMLVGFATHSIRFGGAAMSSGGHVNIFGETIMWFYTPLTAIAVVVFLTSPRRREKILTGLSSLILLVLFSILGRRNIIYTGIIILLALGLAGYRFREISFRKILLLASLGAIIVFSALTFMLLRITGQYIKQGRKLATVTERISTAHNMVQHGGAYALAGKATQTNFQTRTFVLAFLANILDASSRMTPALGVDAMSMIEQSIPSVVYPGKDLFFSEEGLVDKQFGFSYGDQANSVLTAGATDFGFLGMIIYPILVVVVVRFVYELLARRLGMLAVLVVALALISKMMQTEMTFTGYVVSLRDTVLFGALLSVFMGMPRVRFRASS